MIVYTDSTDFADFSISGANWHPFHDSGRSPEIRELTAAAFGEKSVYVAEVPSSRRWRYLFASETSSRSQYDMLIEQRRRGGELPDGLLCLSGAGGGLHGLRNRPWAAETGNIHLSVHLTPKREGPVSGIPFMVLAAVSVLDTIDSVPALASKAAVKWVNDILIENAKVAGVLAYTEGAGQAVDAAVLGIGLNVEKTPSVAGTPFVPEVGSLRDFIPDPAECTQERILRQLLEALDRNYDVLLQGRSVELIDRYRERSVVVGRRVKVYADDAASPPNLIAEGLVEGIGDSLELVLTGRSSAVSRGRLIIDSEGE